MLSVHTSPVATLGAKDAGGMNVYVLELSRELARLGYEVDIFTRLDGALPRVEQIAPNLRLVRIEAGPAEPERSLELALPCRPRARGERAAGRRARRPRR